MIYHGNFGPPLLDEGSQFVASVKEVVPFNDYAAKGIDTWSTYLGPTRGYGEQVYNIIPYADASGSTTVMLRHKIGDHGIRLTYGVAALPYFTLWKNTDTVREGYVTGLEPGTGFAYPPALERTFGRVPKLAPGASQSFTLEYTMLHDPQSEASVAREIAAI